jgi:hypothetical protein
VVCTSYSVSRPVEIIRIFTFIYVACLKWVLRGLVHGRANDKKKLREREGHSCSTSSSQGPVGGGICDALGASGALGTLHSGT